LLPSDDPGGTSTQAPLTASTPVELRGWLHAPSANAVIVVLQVEPVGPPHAHGVHPRVSVKLA
jgi:hypothetical protein